MYHQAHFQEDVDVNITKFKYWINMLAGIKFVCNYVTICHNLLLSSLQILMSAMGQTHVLQMETVSIQLDPFHATVPLAMSWIAVNRAARVSPSDSIPVVSVNIYISMYSI